jgi:heat shock protein HslJ
LFSESGSGLTFTAEPPPRLGGVVWEVTGYNNGRQAVVSVLIDTRITLSFEQGIVSGHAGCNSFRAPYSTEGNRIEIGLVGSTMMACPEEQMAQEQEFLAALQSTVNWNLDGNLLDMHRADGERTIMATSDEQ